MAVELLAGLGIFKSMLDGAKALKDMNDAAVRNAAVIELQEQILSAQAEQSALIQKVRELEADVMKFEDWETEKKRYKLCALPPGVHVYSLKPEMADGEPAHHLCEVCYNKGHKSILHQSAVNSGLYHLKCHSCGADYRAGHHTGEVVIAHGARDDWME